MMKKPDSIVLVKTDIIRFFDKWLELLTPYHNLTVRERSVAAALLYNRYILSRAIVDENVLNQVSLNEDTKEQARMMSDTSKQHFQVIFSTLKQKRFILEGKINPRFIPNIKENGSFNLTFLFEIDELQPDIPAVGGGTESE